jgi:hypothetical protein
LALNDAAAGGKGQRWGMCDVTVEPTRKYDAQYYYDPPKRINGVLDYDSYYKYEDYIKTYTEWRERQAVGMVEGPG